MQRGIQFLLLVVLLSLSAVAVAEGSQPTAAAEKYKALLQQFKQTGRSPQLVSEFLALGREFPEDASAADSLVWVITNARDSDAAAEATELLLSRTKTVDSQQLARFSKDLNKAPSLQSELLLRGWTEQADDGELKSAAMFYLAEHLREQLRLRDALTTQPASKRRFEQFYGKPFTAHLLERDVELTNAEIEKLYDAVASATGVNEEITRQARIQLTEIRHLAVGKPAMEIVGEDIEGQPLKLSDYRGKIVVLTFWGHW